MHVDLPVQVNTVLSALNMAGHEAYIVGGSVRDLARGALVMNDWDITTSASPDEVKAALCDFRIIDTGLKHGTVTALVDAESIEITTFRAGKSLHDDLAHRDFTINAMAYHPQSGLIDPYGGYEDLRLDLIRCVGDADERLQEDPLRILRALRFASIIDMQIDDATKVALHRNAKLLSNVSVERIKSELDKLFCGFEARTIMLQFSNIFAAAIPEAAPMIGFDQHNEHHCYDVWEHTATAMQHIPPEPFYKWALFFHDIGKPSTFSLDEHGVGHFYGHASVSAEIADGVMKRLKFDNATRAHVLFLVKHHGDQIVLSEKSVKRAIQKHGKERMLELIEVFRSDSWAQSQSARFRLYHYDELEYMIEKISSEKECFSVKDLKVNGHDVIALGFEGRQVGWALNRLEDAVLYEELKNERETLLAYLDNLR